MLITVAAGAAVVGAVATNVIGRRVLPRAESWLMMIPVFRTIYAPVKQLVVGVLARQRVRVQARRDGGGSGARLGDGVSDEGVHGRSRRAVPRR